MEALDSAEYLLLPGCVKCCRDSRMSDSDLPRDAFLAMQGIIINGCIRDSEDIAKMPLGVKAVNTYPLKSSKRDHGLSDVAITIAGTIVSPGDYIYADKDGILVSSTELTGT